MPKLTVLTACPLTEPGRHTDGDGLQLFMPAGVLRDVGRGPFLAEARQAATAPGRRSGPVPTRSRSGSARRRHPAPSTSRPNA